MSTSGINQAQLKLNGSSLLSSIAATYTVGPTSSQLAAQSGVQSIALDGVSKGSVGPAVSTDISPNAQLLNKLKQLEAQDPAKFKQVVTDIANQLTTAAQSGTGDRQKFLAGLAAVFTKAESGDLSGFQAPKSSANPAVNVYGQNAAAAAQVIDPSQAGSGTKSGHHHHHHGGGASQDPLANIFKELDSALASTAGRVSSSSTAATGTAISAGKVAAPSDTDNDGDGH